MLGGGTMAPLDIPPYTIASGDRARLYGLNLVGLQRHGFSPEDIRQLKRAYKLLFRSELSLQDAVAAIREAELDSPHVTHLLKFIGDSKRGVTR
jgi:UDP-N-acetylglucosamine acyltransferase